MAKRELQQVLWRYRKITSNAFRNEDKLKRLIASSPYCSNRFERGISGIVRMAGINSEVRKAGVELLIYQPVPWSISKRTISTSSEPAGSVPFATRCFLYAVLFLISGAGTYYGNPWVHRESPDAAAGAKQTGAEASDDQTISNWSNTHEAHPKLYHQPDSIEELERVVRLSHLTKRKVRPVGSGLSPNGIGFSNEAMVNVGLMDKILHVDESKKQVTVQAGAKVEQVVEELKPYGLTLQNFASIKQQQIGGFTQVGAHGTGATIPPVDEQVVSMKLVVPNGGIMELSPTNDPEFFYLARCGIGALGVVAEVTLQCVPAHKLVEYTFVTTAKEVRKKHKKWLRENKHLRYMWIPHTDTVIVVQCNPLVEGAKLPKIVNKYDVSQRLQPAVNLYNECAKKAYRSTVEPVTNSKGDEKSGTGSASEGPLTDEELKHLSFPELRDKLLAFDPLNVDHVKRVNKVESEYWKRSEGYRVGWSHEILGFDCGGQQWVSETCFQCGSVDDPDMKDIKFMEELLQLIKKQNIPSPAPIEQRWTSSTRSLMSPASHPDPNALFSWVGIIMYLPSDESEEREAITQRFFEYRKAAQRRLWDEYGAFEHWAKIEVVDEDENEWIRKRVKKRFPVDEFNAARKDLDPRNILSNEIIDKIFPIIENKVI